MEIWVLGALGRTGRAITAELAARGLPVVLVGRNREQLAATGSKFVVADGVEAIAAEISRQRPAVVVNTIGEYAATAATIARACLPGGHYVDMAADPIAVQRLLDLHDEAQAGGSTFVTGAGFGVLATEAVVASLCEGRPTPSRVQVDALASVATEEGAVGVALAASIVDALTAVSARGAKPRTLVLPDGETGKVAGVDSGERIAAQRASGAPDVTVSSGLAPAAPVVRALLPLLGRVVSIPVVRRFAVRRLAAVRTKGAPRPRTHTWGHAVVTWPDGTTREGWLRAGEAMDFTAAVVAEVAARLARGEGKPGAHTPASALGADVAEAAGGTFLL
ncbi:saccharopine dehydrogenase NADP-binding domain-containing protein [Amycolatopsis sp. CA-128772]|uniref:saccharopine dehydrogenase NADP-binding domain-containing protein n=1 Tax=Amycolatopsis sp. CA-128772 TaxID=2073159 RepID=UPI000CCFF314|nr:saccharopine dehydrogenase NADP-binding domain-containing protein [Amycolatopsis sp. CA-128772]